MMPEKVTMRSPEGEIRDVEADPATLTPLMAAGWHQHLRGAMPRETKAEPGRTPEAK